MSADALRWEALAATLVTRGGVTQHVAVTTKPHPGGVSRSIVLRTTDGVIEISDTYWRKNDQVWTGWQVFVINGDDIVTRQYPRAKARGPIADNVREALKGKVLR